jgi:hypothetical protein
MRNLNLFEIFFTALSSWEDSQLLWTVDKKSECSSQKFSNLKILDVGILVSKAILQRM